MIEDLIRVFEKKYKMYGDDLLLEDYKLEDGIYVLYNLNKADKPLTEFEVSKENSCVDNKYYKNITRYDYYSKVMEMNKAIDDKKKIQSNQIYAFKIKSMNITKEILTPSIENYYEKLEDYATYLSKDKIKIMLFNSLKEEEKATNLEDIKKIKNIIEKNIYKYYNEKEKRIKFFFVKSDLENEVEIEESYKMFKNNYRKYLIPNIYVRTSSCVIQNNKIYGVPNSWYTVNPAKPSLVNSSKLNNLPLLLDINEVEIREKLKEFLGNELKKGNRYIYYSSVDIFPSKELLLDTKNYSYLIQLMLDQGNVIFDKINFIRKKDMKFYLDEIVDFTPNEKKFDDFILGEVDISVIKKALNFHFFGNRLDGYFSNLDIKNDNLKNFTIRYKDHLYNWFFLGNTEIGNIVSMMYQDRFRIALNNKEKVYRVKQIFNIGFNLESYFNNINYKELKMNLSQKLKENLETEKEWVIENDKEFAFVLGQLLYYLNTKTRGKDKYNFEYMRAFYNIETTDKQMVLERINKRFISRCFDFLTNKAKFAVASLDLYVVEGKFEELDKNILVLGATSYNLLFSDKEKEELKKEIVEMEGEE